MLNVQVKHQSIPTYQVGEEDDNPLFLDKRIYQASSGKIYPYPIIDKIYDEKVDKDYEVIVLSNEYIELMIIPSLGGRIQYGYDKILDYYFFYNNEVIKPALVGLCGPWLSGGVEFNWPQHHRPSTFKELEYQIVEAEDCITVWVSEFEKMSQLIGAAGIRIYEHSNRVEVLGRSINETNIPKTFLWWANVAVHCHEEYETFFPRDVKFVADHGKREVTSYPYANNQYYNIDYPNYEMEKRNITNYDNIKVPMSYMAVGSKYHFFGGYDFKNHAGTMHVSNTHTAPGKKQWTWGSGKFGHAWDRHLTDENGPYIELMAGVYTDNQPDFTWINPGESKEFKQTWFPYTGVEKALNANELLAFSIIKQELIIYSTIKQWIKVQILGANGKVQTDELSLGIGQVGKIKLSFDTITSIKVNDLTYAIDNDEAEPFNPAICAPHPNDVKSIDELFNIGLHLEQYRHATRSPLDYYNKILELDSFDARTNTRLGFINLERGNIEKAISYFKVAIATIIKYNPNPSDCSAYFGLGVAYKYNGDNTNAYAALHKAIWDMKYKAVGYLELAKLDLKLEQYELAYQNIIESLKYNAVNLQAKTIKVIIEQKLCQEVDFKQLIVEQAYNYYARFFESQSRFLDYIKKDDKTILEIVKFLDELGMSERAIQLIDESQSSNPLLQIYAINNGVNLKCSFKTKGIFPHTIFERLNMQKYLAYHKSEEISFLLSLLLIDKQDHDQAYQLLETCYQQGYRNSVFLRVLGICEYNLKGNPEKALKLFENAIEVNSTDSRLVYEYDQLRKLLNVDPQVRLEYLTTKIQFVNYRDDLKVEYCWLLCQLNQFEQCIDFMETTKFHPFEGGEGKVIEVYKTAKLAIVQNLINEHKWKSALEILTTINILPKCLGEDIIFGTPNADVLYLSGLCLEKLGDDQLANEMYQSCAAEQVITTSKLSYKPEKLQMNYYQALAYEKIGELDSKRKLINDLRSLANEKLKVVTEVDYFSISVPEFSIFNADVDLVNKAHCYYLLALCELADGNIEESKQYIKLSKMININKLELVII